jgi:2-keto-4-pentenoate hydratase/2-oxohepta-3-ene-1,7-dioic acid hydratase in catechol pathway
MNIFCVVRNYAPHAAEMKSALPAEPTFFEKPHTALLPTPATLRHPTFTHDLQHELELVVRIERTGSHIPLTEAHHYYHSVALGIDLTARDLQRKAKENSMPWFLSKGFDGSAVVSPFVTLAELGKPIDSLNLSLLINGKTVQQGNSGDMIFSPDHLIAHLSQYVTLTVGDLIYTGTPAGIGPLHPGDRLLGLLEDRPLLTLDIAD